MRAIIAAAALGAALITTPALAAEQELCANMHSLADTVAAAKYRGVPISDAMQVANATDLPEARTVLRAIVMDAYALPDYRSPEFQDRQRQEFANEVALHCYSQFQ